MRSLVPPGYHLVELDERVPNVKPDLFFWRWRAERRCRKLNEERLINSYRHEIIRWKDNRWAVVAMQNQLQPDK